MLTRYYARVSSGRQENEETIQSQVAELCARMMEDGIADPQGISDEPYSRDNLVRPGLDRLRDQAAQGELKRLYIQCPDRLASGAKLIFLVEEFQKAGVEVIFLKGAVDLLDEISRGGHVKLYAKKDYFRASMRGEEQLIRSQTRCDNIQHVFGRRETGLFRGNLCCWGVISIGCKLCKFPSKYPF